MCCHGIDIMIIQNFSKTLHVTFRDGLVSLRLSLPSDCGEGKVAADTRDCYLNFHKLHLHLQGNKE